jgi:hypothetical protein
MNQMITITDKPYSIYELPGRPPAILDKDLAEDIPGRSKGNKSG